MKFALVLLFSFTVSVCYSQTDTISIQPNKKISLLYYIDSSESVLAPVIEEILHNLKFNTNDQTIFSEITSLNTYRDEKASRGQISSAFKYYAGTENYSASKQSIENDQKAAKSINKNDLFMLIHIIDLKSVYEFQFRLMRYDVSKGDPVQNGGSKSKKKNSNEDKDNNVKVELGLPNFISNYRNSSVIIDPHSPTYVQDLNVCLRSLIKESNKEPEPFLISKSHRIRGTEINVKRYDTLQIEAGVKDEDSPLDKIKYSFNLEPNPVKYSLFENGEKSKRIIYYDTGSFSIGIKASDGISKGKEIVYTINVISPPVIENLVLKPDYLVSFNPMNETFTSFRSGELDIYMFGGQDFYYNNKSKTDLLPKRRLILDIASRNSPDKLQITGSRIKTQNILPEPITVATADLLCDKTVIENRFDHYRFNILLKNNFDSMLVLPPKNMALPSRYELTVLPFYKNLRGSERTVRLNINKIRKLFFHYGYEYLFGTGVGIRAGVAHAFFFKRLRIDAVGNYGAYFGSVNETGINDFLEGYVIVNTFTPIGIRIGIRDNNPSFRSSTFPSNELAALFGIEARFGRDVSPLINLYLNFYTLANDNNYNNKFSLGMLLEMYSIKRFRTK